MLVVKLELVLVQPYIRTLTTLYSRSIAFRSQILSVSPLPPLFLVSFFLPSCS